MTKKETLWRYILHESITKNHTQFTQKELSKKFNISLSTVFNALKAPRKMGAIEVTGRFFRVRDTEKLLSLWATQRNLEKDILYTTSSDLPVHAIETNMPPSVIFAAFSAYHFVYQEVPADYGVVYIYTSEIESIKKRFPPSRRSYPNIICLRADPYLREFGQTTPDVQTFVDIWNIHEWYTQDFLQALKKKLFI